MLADNRADVTTTDMVPTDSTTQHHPPTMIIPLQMGFTALHAAAKNGHTGTVQLLLVKNVDLATADGVSYSPRSPIYLTCEQIICDFCVPWGV